MAVGWNGLRVGTTIRRRGRVVRPEERSFPTVYLSAGLFAPRQEGDTEVEYLFQLLPGRAPQGAFPYCQDAPSLTQQCGTGTSVSRLVLLDLGSPEVLAGSRPPEPGTAMPMPETAVHKNHSGESGKDQIGAPWQVVDVEAVA